MKTLYVFDFTGLFLFEGDILQISKKLNIKGGGPAVLRYFKRKSLVHKKYYFMENKIFVCPIKKININPLFQQSRIYTKVGRMGKESRFSEKDKYQILYKKLSDEELAEKHNTTKNAIGILRSKLKKELENDY